MKILRKIIESLNWIEDKLHSANKWDKLYAASESIKWDDLRELLPWDIKRAIGKHVQNERDLAVHEYKQEQEDNKGTGPNNDL